MLYSENIFSKWIFLILVIVFIGISLLFYFNKNIDEIDKVSEGFYVVIAIVFVVCIFIVLNFSFLRINITQQEIIVRYGVIRYKTNLNNITKVEKDKLKGIQYGGWGIRIAKIDGSWTLVYNTIGDPRLVLHQKDKKFKRFVFSTKNPEKLITIIQSNIM